MWLQGPENREKALRKWSRRLLEQQVLQQGKSANLIHSEHAAGTERMQSKTD